MVTDALPGMPRITQPHTRALMRAGTGVAAAGTATDALPGTPVPV
jgi:hypothetical protein